MDSAVNLPRAWWAVLLFGFGLGGWAFAQEIGQKTLEQRTATIAEGVEQLQAIHIAEDAEEQARRELIEELCDEGRLSGDDCNEG